MTIERVRVRENAKRDPMVICGLLIICTIAAGRINVCGAEPFARPVYLAQIDAQTVIGHGSQAVLDDLIKGGINTVALQVFPDEGEDGVYWNSSLMPTKRDLLGMFVDKAHEKNLKVWAWMVTLDMPMVYESHPEWRVKAYINGRYTEDTGWYRRVSPFVDDYNDFIKSLYKEIAQKYHVDGFLLQDDLYLGYEEGFDNASLRAFEHSFGKKLTGDILQSDSDAATFCDWKAKQLTHLIRDITAEVKAIDPRVVVAVNVYPETVTLEPSNDICNDFNDIANSADYVAVMAYHKLDPIHPVSWVGIVTKDAIQKVGSGKVILKIQGTDWSNDHKLQNDEVNLALNLARENGAKNFGIYLYNYKMSDYELKF